MKPKYLFCTVGDITEVQEHPSRDAAEKALLEWVRKNQSAHVVVYVAEIEARVAVNS